MYSKYFIILNKLKKLEIKFLKNYQKLFLLVGKILLNYKILLHNVRVFINEFIKDLLFIIINQIEQYLH